MMDLPFFLSPSFFVSSPTSLSLSLYTFRFPSLSFLLFPILQIERCSRGEIFESSPGNSGSSEFHGPLFETEFRITERQGEKETERGRGDSERAADSEEH